jgi:hypothetical protein
MARTTLLIPLAAALCACSFELPDFVGRQGGGGDSFSLQREPVPDPVPIAMTSARLDPALGGIIIQVEGLTPTQGYYSAQLLNPTAIPIDEAEDGGVRNPDEYIDLRFIAYPPPEAQAVGPVAGRKIRAALFMPNRYLQDASGVRIFSGSGSRTLSLD